MAATGQALNDWIKVEKSLPPTSNCPWDNDSSSFGKSPISYAPPTVKSNKATTGNNAWGAQRSSKPPPGFGSPQPTEPVKSPWGAPAPTSAPAPWGAPAPSGSLTSPWGAKPAPKNNVGADEDFPTLGATKPRRF